MWFSGYVLVSVYSYEYVSVGKIGNKVISILFNLIYENMLMLM